jgi:hypothetical protein
MSIASPTPPAPPESRPETLHFYQIYLLNARKIVLYRPICEKNQHFFLHIPQKKLIFASIHARLLNVQIKIKVFPFVLFLWPMPLTTPLEGTHTHKPHHT